MNIKITVEKDGQEIQPSDLSAETWANLRTEKPKQEIKHGDFGVSPRGKHESVVCISGGFNNHPHIYYAGGRGQCNVNGPADDEPNKYGYIIFGNIFDLLAEVPSGKTEYRLGDLRISLDYHPGYLRIGELVISRDEELLPILFGLIYGPKLREAQCKS